MNRIVALTLCLIIAGHSSLSLSADDWSATLSPEQAKADLTSLYEGLQSGHYNLYANRTQVEYDALYTERLDAISTPLSRFDVWRELQLFAAFGNVAHARINFPGEVYGAYRDSGGKAFPIYLRIVGGRAYVGEDYSGVDAVSAGDEILSLDGASMSEWLARTARYLSADTPYIAHSMLETSFPAYLWLVAGEQEEYRLELRKNNNRKMQVRIEALTYEELVANIESTPPAFSLDYNARESKIIDSEIAYLRPGPFYNAENPERVWDNSAYLDFINESFSSFLEAGTSVLIIDLRNNPGGDSSFSDPMISWIADQPFRFASRFLVRSSDEAAASNQARLDSNPDAAESVSGRYAEAFAATPRGEDFDFDIAYAEPREGARFEGDVYVMVNRNSYSNAVNTASIFKDYGWAKIVGEPTADFATTYGAMEHFTLPHSGLLVDFPKAHIIRPSGDETPGGVTPDISIDTPIEARTTDVVLDTLIETLRKGGTGAASEGP